MRNERILFLLENQDKLNSAINKLGKLLILLNCSNDYEKLKNKTYTKTELKTTLLFLIKLALFFNDECLKTVLNELEIISNIKIQGRTLNTKKIDLDNLDIAKAMLENIYKVNNLESLVMVCNKLFDGKKIINKELKTKGKVSQNSINHFYNMVKSTREHQYLPIIHSTEYYELKTDIPELDIHSTSEIFNIKKTDLHNLIKEKLITVVKNLGDGKIYLTRESIGDLIDIFYNYYAEYITTSDGRYIPNENTEPITTKHIREELKRILGIPTSVKHSGFYSVQEIAEHTNLTINQIHKRLSSCNKKGLLKFHYLDKSISRKTPSKNDKKYISHQDFIKIFKRELDQDKINQLLKGGENVSN